jgi:hypothetical protein
MKSCYWCELAGEPSQHPDDEIGGIDADTEKWICGDCADIGEPVTTACKNCGVAETNQLGLCVSCSYA